MASKVCLGLRSRPKASDDLGYLHLAGVLGEKLGEGVDAVAFLRVANRPLAAARICSNRAASTTWFRKPYAIALRAAKPRRRTPYTIAAHRRWRRGNARSVGVIPADQGL